MHAPALEPPKRHPLADPSLWILLLTNAATVYFAVTEGWSMASLMWVYWFQSVIIGLFNFVRILELEAFSAEGLRFGGQPVDPTAAATKWLSAFFFLFHYGFFHLVYLLFLSTGMFADGGEGATAVETRTMALTVLIFFVNHLFSYLYNRSRERRGQDIGTVMFRPYARIIPMHLTIIFGGFFGGTPLLLLGLKTLVDVVGHVAAHRFRPKGAMEARAGSGMRNPPIH